MSERTYPQELANLILNEVTRWWKKGYELKDIIALQSAAFLKVNGWITAQEAKLIIKWGMVVNLTDQEKNQMQLLVSKLEDKVR